MDKDKASKQVPAPPAARPIRRLALLTGVILTALAFVSYSGAQKRAPAPGFPANPAPRAPAPPAPAQPTPHSPLLPGIPSPEGFKPLPPRQILLLGIDQRPEDPGRSDTIMLVRVDETRREVKLLSVPRDSRVEIPGHGWDKINAAYAYGGPDLAMKTITKLLGIPVHYYVTVNTQGVAPLVDTLGGLEIDVEEPMYYDDPVEGLSISLGQGRQRLDGNRAMQYLRFRMDPDGDISRIRRQQQFLQVLARQLLTPANFGRLPRWVALANRYVKSNVPSGEQLRLALAIYNSREKISAQTLPGGAEYIDGVSYWLVDPDRARSVAREFLAP